MEAIRIDIQNLYYDREAILEKKIGIMYELAKAND